MGIFQLFRSSHGLPVRMIECYAVDVGFIPALTYIWVIDDSQSELLRCSRSSTLPTGTFEPQNDLVHDQKCVVFGYHLFIA